MADCGEPLEITTLRTNLTSITDTVTVGGNLQWFSNRLVEKAFIPRRAAQGILDISGVTPAIKAGHLMNSVFVVLRTTDERRRRFDEFVSIFSTDEAYAGLVSKFKRCVENKGADHRPTSPLHTLRSWTNTIKQWFNGLTQWFTSTSEGEGSEVTPAAPTPPCTTSAAGSEESPAPLSTTTSSSLLLQPPPSPHNSSAAGGEQVALSLSAEYALYPRGYNQVCWATASLKAPFYEAAARAPVDIVAVIDKSGSMHGAKLDLVKKTFLFVIDQCALKYICIHNTFVS